MRRSPPNECPVELESVDDLPRQRGLIAVGSGAAALEEILVRPILAKLQPAEQHLGELVRAREGHLTDGLVGMSAVEVAAQTRAVAVVENLAAERGGEALRPTVGHDTCK